MAESANKAIVYPIDSLTPCGDGHDNSTSTISAQLLLLGLSLFHTRWGRGYFFMHPREDTITLLLHLEFFRPLYNHVVYVVFQSWHGGSGNLMT